MKTNQQDYAPRRLTNATAAFLELRRATLAEMEQEVEHNKYLFSLQLEERQRQAEQARQLLAQAGIELEHLDYLESEEDKLLADFLQELPPPLIEQPRELKSHLQERFARGALNQHMGEAATLLGADVAALPEADDDPTFVWLYEADRINLVATAVDIGWGCFVKQNPNFHHPTAQWWYTWTPPQDGVYSFWAVAPYSGFYRIRANDEWYNCKYAKAHAYVDVGVHQYFWRYQEQRTIVDKRGSNIQDVGLVSGAIHWFFYEPLRADDEVTVRVTTTLNTYAQGSGSHVALNFSDGQGNYLGAPGVFISKVQNSS